MSGIRVVGFDPSLRNWGIARGYLHLDQLTISDLEVYRPVLPTGKQIRQNSVDLMAATQLGNIARAYAEDAHAIFVEVPVGSQNARSMASYGICVGILGTLRGLGIPFFEITPTQVKLAATGNKNATKQDMIQWATTRHPEAPWPLVKAKGVTTINESQAEHAADAIAAIYAGLDSQEFKQMTLFNKRGLRAC